MKRIIQKYQEGGVVQPGVATGLPAGGNAGPAIQRYLNGYVSSPLSYNGVRNSYVPDYRKLADKRKEIRDDTTTTTTTTTDTTGTDTTNQDSTRETVADINTLAADKATSPSNVYYSTDSFGNDVPYTIVTPTEVRGPGYIDNTPSNFPEIRDYYDSSPRGEGGSAISYSSDGTSTDLGFDLGPAVLGGRGTYVQAPATNKFMQAITGPLYPDNPGYITGGRTGHATDNDGPPKPGDSDYAAYSAQVATSNILDGHGAGGGGHTGVVFDNSNDSYVVMIDGKRMGSRGGAKEANERLAELTSGLNNGGPISMNPSRVQKYNNGSTGGVAIANTRLSEEEIRQRQLMQSPLPQAQASPLSNIGSQLAMGAVDKGIGSAASSMAAKKGLMSTFGKALGGNAATGAATSAAGTGLMAALGPIGIGLGLGKLFGVFNDGGKVPYTKRKKSPLSGE